MNRRQIRENIFKLLYSSSFHEEGSFEEHVEIFAKENEVSESDMDDISAKVKLVQDKYAEIDEMIAKASKNWSIDRISLVDKTLLRLIIFESLYDENIPVGVAMNEGIELAKIYGSNKSPKFINGVAGKVING